MANTSSGQTAAVFSISSCFVTSAYAVDQLRAIRVPAGFRRSDQPPACRFARSRLATSVMSSPSVGVKSRGLIPEMIESPASRTAMPLPAVNDIGTLNSQIIEQCRGGGQVLKRIRRIDFLFGPRLFESNLDIGGSPIAEFRRQRNSRFF